MLSTEIQKYLLIKIATPSTARQFQDTRPVCVLSYRARIFCEQKNRLWAGAAPFLQTALPHRQTEGPCKPLTDGHVRAQWCPSLMPIWDCYSPGKPETKFSSYLESILLPSLYKSQASSLMKKVIFTPALPFLCFDLRYHWLCLIVSLLQSNLLKRSKQNTRSQIHRWYNSIDFSSITPGIDSAITASIKVSGKEVYLLS